MEGLLDLPPGFRFHPTDEEVIVDYLRKKVLDGRFNSIAIVEVDLNKCEPWDLSTKNGEKELYVFYHKDRKYPTGSRTNRATKSGYWKATGKDKAIYKGKGNLVGMKKTLVFYKGRAPRGGKTNWVMHEFRLEDKFYKNLKGTEKVFSPFQDEWVVCRVINKSDGPMDQMITTNPIPSYLDQNHDLYVNTQTLPPLIDAPYPDTTVTTLPYSIPFNNNDSSSCTDQTGDFKYFSPNDVLQPNRTSFIPPSITPTTFNPQFTFNNPYTTHLPYVSNSPILSIDPTPISMDNFQYLHQDGSINGFIDPNQTTQISKEEETLDLLFTDPVLGMHRSQSTEDISHILSFDGLFGGAPFSSWKF